MSQENVEVVRRALSALDRRDVEAYLAVASPAIELINPASPLEGPYGPRRIRQFSASSRRTPAPQVQIEEIEARDDGCSAFFTITASGRNSGVETSSVGCRRLRPRDGKSDAPISTPTAPRPSKPWGCRSELLPERRS